MLNSENIKIHLKKTWANNEEKPVLRYFFIKTGWKEDKIRCDSVLSLLKHTVHVVVIYVFTGDTDLPITPHISLWLLPASTDNHMTYRNKCIFTLKDDQVFGMWPAHLSRWQIQLLAGLNCKLHSESLVCFSFQPVLY